MSKPTLFNKKDTIVPGTSTQIRILVHFRVCFALTLSRRRGGVATSGVQVCRCAVASTVDGTSNSKNALLVSPVYNKERMSLIERAEGHRP